MNLAERLERTQWDLFWLPPDASVAVDRPDLLLLTCRRPVPFLNVVLRARCAPSDALALVDEAASHPSLTRWVVTDTFDRAPLGSALSLRGWAPGPPMEVRVLDVDAWTRPATLTVRRVDTRSSLLDAMRVTERAFDQPSESTEDSLAADLRQCTEGNRVHRFVVVDAHGEPVSSGGLTSFPDLQMGLLWAGGTVAEARGHGAYTSLLAARVACARSLGLRWVGLYARAATSAPIVARHGFTKHGEMNYWERASAR